MKQAVLLAALLPVATIVHAQEPRAPVRLWEHQRSDIPADPSIHFGALANGLRFAWVDNAEPKQRCCLRLHVDVGSLAEEDSERGMAHFLEHMAFNGSKRFPSGTLVEWFQRHGMNYSADTNASTGYSQTVYQLDLPLSDEKTIGEGLRVLRDFADGLTLDQKDIDAERGVIDGEERERDSVETRVYNEMLRLQLSGTRIPERSPIGTKAARDGFDADSLRKFYAAWYRPENMTLLLVGDLRGKSPEALIEAEFADMARPPTPVRGEPPSGKPDMQHACYAIHDAELPSVTLVVQKAKPFLDRADDKARLAGELQLLAAAYMLNVRFFEIGKRPDAPFGATRLGDSRTRMEAQGIRVQEGLVLTVRCGSENWASALAAAEQELRRAIELGFDEAELAEARTNILRAADDLVAREKTQSSASVIQGLLRAAENRFVPIGANDWRDFAKPRVEALDGEACRRALAEAWNGGELVIGFAGPLDLGTGGPLILKDAYEKSLAQKLEARTKTEAKSFAYASDPSKAGEITLRSHDEEFDFHEVLFANGVRLHVKKTDFKEEQVLVSVQIGEGALSLDPTQRPMCRVATGILVGCGLKEHSSDELRRLNAGKRVGCAFAVGEQQFTLDGTTTREDLLRELELMCAQFTHPGWRDEGMRQFQRQVDEDAARIRHEHTTPVNSEFMPAVCSFDPRAAWVTESSLRAVELPAVSAWIEAEFASAPIDVVVVGDLDVDEAIAAASRTFGMLPKRRAADTHEDRRKPIKLMTGLEEKYSLDTSVQKTLVAMLIPTTDGRDTATRRNLGFLADVLEDRLRIEVRERLGASYAPSAHPESSEVAPGYGLIVVDAMADPDKVDELVEACASTCETLATRGVTAEEVDRLRTSLLPGYHESLRTNRYWVYALSRFHTSTTVTADMRTYLTSLEKLDPDTLTQLAKAYLRRDRANVAIVAPKPPEKDE